MSNSPGKLEQQPENNKSSTENLVKDPNNSGDNEKVILLSGGGEDSYEKPKIDGGPVKHTIEELRTKKENYNKKSTMDNAPFLIKSKRIQELEKFLDSKFFQIIINVMTVYALFADDIRSAFLPKSVDNGFDSITIVCMVLFTIEIILSVITKEKYFNSFFFWLDIISTISLIFDLKWFQSAVLVNP